MAIQSQRVIRLHTSLLGTVNITHLFGFMESEMGFQVPRNVNCYLKRNIENIKMY